MGCIKQLTFKGPQVNAETYQGICGGGEKGGIYPPFYHPIFGKIGILSIPVYHAYTCKFCILCARVVKLLLKYRRFCVLLASYIGFRRKNLPYRIVWPLGYILNNQGNCIKWNKIIITLDEIWLYYDILCYIFKHLDNIFFLLFWQFLTIWTIFLPFWIIFINILKKRPKKQAVLLKAGQIAKKQDRQDKSPKSRTSC